MCVCVSTHACVHFWLQYTLICSAEDKRLHFYEPFPLQQQTAITARPDLAAAPAADS